MPLFFKLWFALVVTLALGVFAITGTFIVSNFHYIVDPVSLVRDLSEAAGEGFRESDD